MNTSDKGGCRPQYMPRDEYLARAVELASRGEARPNAVMTPERVRLIRENRYGWSSKDFARAFGCHYRTVQKVQYYETWTHI